MGQPDAPPKPKHGSTADEYSDFEDSSHRSLSQPHGVASQSLQRRQFPLSPRIPEGRLLDSQDDEAGADPAPDALPSGDEQEEDSFAKDLCPEGATPEAREPAEQRPLAGAAVAKSLAAAFAAAASSSHHDEPAAQVAAELADLRTMMAFLTERVSEVLQAGPKPAGKRRKSGRRPRKGLRGVSAARRGKFAAAASGHHQMPEAPGASLAARHGDTADEADEATEATEAASEPAVRDAGTGAAAEEAVEGVVSSLLDELASDLEALGLDPLQLL